jgi:hypothetical protein
MAEKRAASPAVYQAVVGLNFDGLKPPVRVESGGVLPDKVSAADINWLSEQGLIRQVMLNKESDGDE